MLASLGYAAAYTGVGLVLLLLGFLVLDLLTPGRLAEQIWTHRSVNASIVLGAGLLGVGAVAFTTIWTNATSGFGSALGWTVVFGVAGFAKELGRCGRCGKTLTDEESRRLGIGPECILSWPWVLEEREGNS